MPLAKEYSNIIVLRGTSKFFAAPGLRLGYAITGNEELLTEIHTKKNPWTINSLAAIAGEIMFQDEAYIKETRTLILSERRRLSALLSKDPVFYVYPANGNFILVRLLKEGLTADYLFDAAIRNKMMIRNCATFPFLDEHYIRFCIMSPQSNDKLIACLKDAAANLCSFSS